MVSGAQVYFSLAGEAHHFRERLLGRGGLDSAGTRHLAADPAGLAAPADGDTALQPRCSRSTADRRVVPHLFRPRPPATGNRLLQRSYQLRIAGLAFLDPASRLGFACGE